MLAKSMYEIAPGEVAELLLKSGDTIEAKNKTGETIRGGRFVAVSESAPHVITHDIRDCPGDRRC